MITFTTLELIGVFLIMLIFGGATFATGYYMMEDKANKWKKVAREWQEYALARDGEPQPEQLALPAPKDVSVPVPVPEPEPEPVAPAEDQPADVEEEFKRWWSDQHPQEDTTPADEQVQVIEEAPESTPAPPPKVRIFTFTSPHDEEDTFEAVLRGLSLCDRYRDEFGAFIPKHHPDKPPLEKTLYFSEMSRRRIVLNLGNRTTHYWAMTINMTPTENGVKGVVGFDRRYGQIKSEWLNGELTNLYALSPAVQLHKRLANRFGFDIRNYRDYEHLR